MPTSDPDARATVGTAARHALLVTASVAALVIVGMTVGLLDGMTWHQTLRSTGFFFTSWPAWAIVISGVSLFALTVRRPPPDWWGYVRRGALSGYIGIVTGSSLYLLLWEVTPGQPGRVGGFLLVVISAIGFTLLGGPLWVGLLTALLRPRSTGTEEARERRGVSLLLLVGGVCLALGTVLTSAVGGTGERATYECMTGGPVPTEPPLAVISEASDIVRGSFSLWPLGRKCEWQRADGNGTVTVDSGAWGTTALAGGGALTALVGAGMLLAPRRVAPPIPRR